MVGKPPVNTVDGTERLWDESGREWGTKHIRWATAKEVRVFLRRKNPVGHIDDRGLLAWLNPDEAEAFWSATENSFEVPGDGIPASTLPSWGAHIWRHEKERRLIFTMFT